MSTLTRVWDTKILTLLNGFEVFNTVTTRCVEIARDLELKTKHNYVLKCDYVNIK